jgi:hypothetical protein
MAKDLIARLDKGNYYLQRVGDAISSRNIHAAIYDLLRICKNILSLLMKKFKNILLRVI